MFAKSIRVKFLSSIFTKSISKNLIVSSYKIFFIFDDISFTSAFYLYSNHALNQVRKFCNQWIKSQQVNQSEIAHYQEFDDSMHDSKLQRAFVEQYVDRKSSFILHTCRRCFRIFCSNNDLHEHLRCTHLKHRHRRRFIEQNRFDQRLHRFWK